MIIQTSRMPRTSMTQKASRLTMKLPANPATTAMTTETSPRTHESSPGGACEVEEQGADEQRWRAAHDEVDARAAEVSREVGELRVERAEEVDCDVAACGRGRRPPGNPRGSPRRAAPGPTTRRRGLLGASYPPICVPADVTAATRTDARMRPKTELVVIPASRARRYVECRRKPALTRRAKVRVR